MKIVLKIKKAIEPAGKLALNKIGTLLFNFHKIPINKYLSFPPRLPANHILTSHLLRYRIFKLATDSGDHLTQAIPFVGTDIINPGCCRI
jgi:hypothetical protein